MKRMFGVLVIVSFLAACNGAGERKETAPYSEDQKPPSSNPNPESTGPADNSTTGVQDTSTVIDYDTAARKH
jgi:hypothetical protein